MRTSVQGADTPRFAELKGGLGRHVPHTRQILRKLSPGRIRCAPFHDARGRGYTLSAVGSYEGLLSGKLAVKYGGGEGGLLPSLTDALRFELRALAMVA